MSRRVRCVSDRRDLVPAVTMQCNSSDGRWFLGRKCCLKKGEESNLICKWYCVNSRGVSNYIVCQWQCCVKGVRTARKKKGPPLPSSVTSKVETGGGGSVSFGFFFISSTFKGVISRLISSIAFNLFRHIMTTRLLPGMDVIYAKLHWISYRETVLNIPIAIYGAKLVAVHLCWQGLLICIPKSNWL